MANEVFVDTSGFYACLVRHDDRHPEAAALLKRHGHLIGDFTTVTLRSQACRIEWMDPGQFETAHRYLLQHGDHDFSFTECFSFCVMNQLRLREALTKDQHFREAGFRPLLV